MMIPGYQNLWQTLKATVYLSSVCSTMMIFEQTEDI